MVYVRLGKTCPSSFYRSLGPPQGLGIPQPREFNSGDPAEFLIGINIKYFLSGTSGLIPFTLQMHASSILHTRSPTQLEPPFTLVNR